MLPEPICSGNQWRIQGGFLVARKPPPAMIFFKLEGLHPYMHAPTFTSHLNLRLLETPLETNSGYATAQWTKINITAQMTDAVDRQSWRRRAMLSNCR